MKSLRHSETKILPRSWVICEALLEVMIENWFSYYWLFKVQWRNCHSADFWFSSIGLDALHSTVSDFLPESRYSVQFIYFLLCLFCPSCLMYPSLFSWYNSSHLLRPDLVVTTLLWHFPNPSQQKYQPFICAIIVYSCHSQRLAT